MEIRIDSLIEGATRAKGTVVIVDVFRAFTTAAIAFLQGAEKIILVSNIQEALELRRQGIGDLCIGEVGGVQPIGFDFGNSPFELSSSDIRNKTLIQSTRAGIVGANTAQNADTIYLCSLVCASETAKEISRQQPNLVTIVAMGAEGKIRTDEDEQCALYLRNLLQGRSPDPNAVRSLILSGESSAQFDNLDLPQFHPEDREIALRINSAALSIKANMEEKFLVARSKRP